MLLAEHTERVQGKASTRVVAPGIETNGHPDELRKAMLGRFRLEDREVGCAQGDRADKSLDRANRKPDGGLGDRLPCPLMVRAW